VRGREAVDLPNLLKIMVRFSQLVVEQPWIKEIDINPLLASPEQIIALDARVVLHPLDTTLDEFPRPAIRPYPTQYVEQWTSRGGLKVSIRPIRPEDEPLLIKFHETLSERTVYMRYLQAMNLSQRTGHERLSRISFIDYDREIALVAEQTDVDGGRRIVAIGRLSKEHAVPEAEFAILVGDRWQRRGLGAELLRRLITIGRDEGLELIWADLLAGNTGMRRTAESVGFRIVEGALGDSTVRAALRLG